MFDTIELNKKLVSELREIAKSLNVLHSETLKKDELVQKIIEAEMSVNNQEEKSSLSFIKNDISERPKRKRKQRRATRGFKELSNCTGA